MDKLKDLRDEATRLQVEQKRFRHELGILTQKINAARKDERERAEKALKAGLEYLEQQPPPPPFRPFAAVMNGLVQKIYKTCPSDGEHVSSFRCIGGDGIVCYDGNYWHAITNSAEALAILNEVEGKPMVPRKEILARLKEAHKTGRCCSDTDQLIRDIEEGKI
jgi:hypothetical protein